VPGEAGVEGSAHRRISRRREQPATWGIGYTRPTVKVLDARRPWLGCRRLTLCRRAVLGALTALIGLTLLGSRAGDSGASAPAGLATPPSGDATPEEPAWAEGTIAELMTREHNLARARVSTATPLPGLTWSPPLAAVARQWAGELAQRCEGLKHPAAVKHGQNLASRSSMGSATRFSPSEAVAGWMAEASCWTHGRFGTTDRCDKSCVSKLNSTGCGHYTQVVWRRTRELGCGYASCKRDGFLVEYWACNYSPPGNVRGQEPY
jgi:pathogenesis-related protein 1